MAGVVSGIGHQAISPKLTMAGCGLAYFMTGIQPECLQDKELENTWRELATEQILGLFFITTGVKTNVFMYVCNYY